MKRILFLAISLAITAAAFVPVQKAEATFDIPDFDICDIVPAFCQITPSVAPSVSPEPSGEPTVEPSAEPSIEVTATPTVAPASSSNTENHGDGKSDGRSDGLCSKPPCVSGNVVPKAPPATGRSH